ncbi:MAG: phosphate ABC transporter substrate-binding protein PstS [Gemmatimonadota bacterium]|nr:phosphate ABC transporter substrate-binding protein PstS [Gemmatimonadota bacterium]HEU4988388.1 phosphate ABC transporter substrate-binding protein PstS [Gemmatimonadaceae bacterium]
MKQKLMLAAAALAALAGTAAAQGADLTGAGSTFAQPIYAKWADAYAAKTGVKINYASIGSGGGIHQLSEMTVDFGATDGPMTDEQLAQAKGGPILHIPTVIGAVAISYNLPGLPLSEHLKFDGPTLADIYLGKITKWNDARLAKLNPGVKLPDTDILVVHRSEGSGTTYIFTDYLSRVSPEWAKGPGKSISVQWPVGVGGKGSEGVAGQIKQVEGAIGYVELAYVTLNHLPYGLVKNADGTAFLAPSLEGATNAAAGTAAKLPKTTDFRISIVNAPGAKSYPISSFTWIVLYKNQPNAVKGKKLLDFLRWAMKDGEPMAASLQYAPMPKNMQAMVLARLNEVKLK